VAGGSVAAGGENGFIRPAGFNPALLKENLLEDVR